MKKAIKQAIIGVVCTFAVSAVGAVIGVWANDKVQDSKIDMLIISVKELSVKIDLLMSKT